MTFDVSRMAYRPDNHTNAVKQQARRIAEKALRCEQCGTQNKPGAILIDIDDHDCAWCLHCQHNWAVRIDAV